MELRLLLVFLGLITGIIASAIPAATKVQAADSDQGVYNYVIFPPSDDPTLRFGAGGSNPLGANSPRIQFQMDNTLPGEPIPGTSVGYLPYQFLVASSNPQASFQLRGGGWFPGEDWYDRTPANPGWVVNDFIKKRGLISPIYYEVYQLSNDNPRSGRLLGVINPRDRNIFPSTDSNPASDNCSGGGCWRQFDLSSSGNGRITLNGAQQDSCSKRFGQWPHGCYQSTKISAADSQTRLAEKRDQDIAMGNILSSLQLGNIPKDSRGKSKGIADSIKDFFVGEKALANHVGGTHQITVFVNPRAHSPGKVTVQIFGGACNDNVKTVGPDGSVTFGGCPNGHSFTAAVHQSKFDDGPHFPNPPGGPSIHCSIGQGAKTQAVGGDNQAHFTYNCTREILVWANPRGVTGGKVTARIFGGACNDNQKVVNSNGYALFAGCPLVGHTYNAVVLEDKFTKLASGGVVYTCETDGNKNKNVGSDNQVNFFYHCDRHNPIANDGGLMSRGTFERVDSNARFSSSRMPNLNGNYVFLIKQVNYADINSGYVTTYDRLKLAGPDAGCPVPEGGNRVNCPTDLLQRADNENTERIVQNGFYLRVPKVLNGNSNTRQQLATAPVKISFGISFGPTNVQGHYEGLRFQAGGLACREPYNSDPGGVLTIPNADWDKESVWFSPGFDDIDAKMYRIGVRDDRGNLNGGVFNQPGYPYFDPVVKEEVGDASISGSWQSSTTNKLDDVNGQWAIYINHPGRPNEPFANTNWFGFGEGGNWQQNEAYAGTLGIVRWNQGNQLLQGGQAFTTGFWPTCRPPGPQAFTPKVYPSHVYNGQDNFTQLGNTGDAVLDFKFRYSLPEFRPKVDWRVDISTNSSFSGREPISQSGTDLNVEVTGGNPKVVPINTKSLSANTDYYWRGCINDQVNGDRCTATTRFRVNKGPTAQIVSGDPDYNTNTGNVNYNCSELAVRLTDPEGHQVRPHFAITWTKDGRTNVVSSTNFGAGGNSDTWGSWVSGNGYKPSGSTFSSDDVRPVRWTVNGSSRSVPNMTLTEFLQDDRYVPEGADITWQASGEDRFGASDVGTSPSDFFYQVSTPRAAHDASPFGDSRKQDSLNYRRFGSPVSANFHKNTRPNLLPPGSTKEFKDLTGAAIENVTDGQTIQVETTLRNTGETPTKRYQIADYLGSVRDFEPPLENNGDFPITVQYNNGEQRAVDPVVSRVIPNRGNGLLDQPENLNDTDDDRRASYKLDFGENPTLEDEEQVISVEQNGDDYIECSSNCSNDPKYPHDVYWLTNGWARYQMSGLTEGTYDLRLEYFNGLTNEPDRNPYPPDNYTYNIRIDWRDASETQARSKTVQLPIESNSQSRELHEFIVRDLEITGPNPIIRITWDNNRFQLGQYDTNFGLNKLGLTTAARVLGTITKDGEDYSYCRYGNGAAAYCMTDYATYPDSVYFYCGGTGQLPGACGGTNNAPAVWSYRMEGAEAKKYDLSLSYYNRPNFNHSNPDPPPGYGSYRIKVDYPGGSRTVRLPIESNSQARSLHTFTLEDLDITSNNPTITLTWDNDAWENGDANFGLDEIRLDPKEDTSDSILRPGELRPGEAVTLRYWARANRNWTTTSLDDQNRNLQRRLQVGDADGPRASQSDPKGGTIDIGDAHTFVPYSEDYCDRSNPLINHTCEFEPGDVLAPWFRGQRGSIATNESAFGYDPLAGEDNATFLVQANGTLSHFSGGTDSIGGYQAGPTECAPAGKIDWRKQMYGNIQRLLSQPHNSNAETRAMLNGNNVKDLKPNNRPNVWLAEGNLTINGTKRFRDVGTIIVRGNLIINDNLRYEGDTNAINSLGIIVLGNVSVNQDVADIVGSYYVSDIRRDLSGTTEGCPNTAAGQGIFSTGRSGVQLRVQGLIAARQFELLRYYLDPSDSVADPAEDVYYDGRVVANTPPGFSTFRDTAAWYEIAP